MAAAQAAADSGQGSSALIGEPRFVGREVELARLEEALVRPTAIVSIEGEAGVGKSRLLLESLALPTLRSRNVILAVCPPFRSNFTLGPVVDALRQSNLDPAKLALSGLAGALRPLFPEWSEHLPATPEAAEDASVQRHRLFSALIELVSLSGAGILVLEDAHWADDATLEFLLFLASRRPSPVSVAVTYRREDTSDDSLLWRLLAHPPTGVTCARIELSALDESGTAALIASMLGGREPGQDFVRLVFDSTEGLPLAVEESMRLLRERADVEQVDGEWVRHRIDKIAVPPTVRDAVLERVARLGADVRAVLEATAVLAEPSDEGAVRAVSGLSPDAARSALATALASGLLAEGGGQTASFRHALAARAVYESIPSPRRRQLHLRAGELLETRVPPPATRLVRHFRESHDTARWLKYGEQVADMSRSAGDLASAESALFDLVVDARLPAAEMVRLAGKIAFASLTGNERYRSLAEALQSALAAPGLEPATAGQLHRQIGRLLIAIGDYDRGRAELESALPHLAGDHVESARTMMMLAVPYGSGGTAATHLEWLRRATELPAPQDEAARVVLLADRVTHLLMLGEESGWLEAEAVPIAPESASLRVTVMRGNLNIGDQAIVWGRYGTARVRLEAALRIATEGQLARVRGVAEMTLLHLDWMTGDWQGLAERARELSTVDGLMLMVPSEATLVEGLLAAATGALDEAEHRLGSVVAEARLRGATPFLIEPAAALARLRLFAGQVEEAVALTDEAIAAVTAKQVWLWATEVAPVRVRALGLAGRITESRSLVDAFAGGLGSRAAPAAQAALATCQASLAELEGDAQSAAELFGAAAAQWDRLPRPYEALLARERRAECLWGTGEADASRAGLLDVSRELLALGATGDAQRVDRSLRERGVDLRSVWRGGNRGYGDELSPREKEVVRLVVAGHTNREVGELLFRSRHTVDNQLKSAMRKLKVTSRTALAVWATEQGLVDSQPTGPEIAADGS